MNTMTTTMTRRMMRALGLLTVVAAIAFGLAGVGTARASNGYETWVGPYADGCYLYWDGYQYTTDACPRGDGSFNFYVPSNGQWAYSYTAGYDANGCYFFWNGYQYTVYTCPVSVGQTKWSTMGGDSVLFPDVVITNYTPGSGYTTIGGDSVSGGWTPTGNALIDSIMIEANYEANAIWLTPTCIEVVNGVCYY